MFKSMKRAQRRQDIARLKRNRNNYWGPDRWSARHNAPPVAPTPMAPAQLGKVVQYPKSCSCAGCCNVRRAPNMNEGGRGWTRQETRHWHNYLEGLAELE
jgi:hypothetical protein